MASRDRESQFPATSIGRTSGDRLQQTTSTVVPESHPLGFPPPEATLNHPKYRPYTPRHRVAPTVTTGTVVHPPSPGRHHPAGGGDATTKLQLTNAKAVAQNVGLDTVSVGWAILEKVVAESETGELWAEIWSAVTGGSGKATLLLPAEQISSHDKFTPEFLKDHIALYDDSTRKDLPVPVITLSGLRGTLHRNQITFYSTIHPSSQLFHGLLDPQTRTSTFRKLPPLPPSSSSSSSYPSIKIEPGTSSTTTTTLPLPPRAPTTAKPPLPPRPGSLRSSTTTTTATPSNVSSTSIPPTITTTSSSSSTSSSRIPNPFASLFGNRPSTPTPPTSTPTPIPIPAPAPAPAQTSSPSSSIRSLDPPGVPAESHNTVIEVSAIIIDKKIIRKDVGKQMNKGVKGDIREALMLMTGTGGAMEMGSGQKEGEREMPAWVVQRVVEVCDNWLPFVRAPKVIRTGTQRDGESGRDREKEKEKEWVVNPNEETPDEIAEWLGQEFYTLLEEDLRIELGKYPNSEESSGDITDPDTEQEKEVKEDNGLVEARIYEIMEVVERTICSAFYDRLFMQPCTDDASHDEALANRVAALNMLDLTLEHLDIEVGEAGREVDKVVRACGAKLCELDMARAPRDKARILVDAHQLVVDGLSRLPPIRLMSPEESKALREQQQQQQQQGQKTARPRVLSEKEDADTHLRTIDIVPPTPLSQESTSSAPQQQQQLQLELSPLSLAETKVLPSSPQTHSGSLPPPPPPLPPSRTTTPTPVSSDVLFPMIIFSVAKSNPPRLVSNLRYTQRFRCRHSASHAPGQAQAQAGEEAFCLINVLAVAEFLENVDLEGLGLSTGSVSAAELTPIIPRTTPSSTPTTPTTQVQQLTPKSGSGGAGGAPLLAGIDTLPGALRGKVEQRVDAIAGSANKVISGVVDSSFGILRSLLPNNNNNNNNTQQQQQQQQQTREVILAGATHEISAFAGPNAGANVGGVQQQTSTGTRPGLGQIMRRETGGFSTLASIAASLPLARGSAPRGEEEVGQQLVTVSRSGSVRSGRSGRSARGSLRGVAAESESESEEESGDESDGSTDEEEESGEESGEEEDDGEGVSGSGSEEGESQEEERKGVDIPGISLAEGVAASSTNSFAGDARSIRSFESMLSDSKKRDRERKQKKIRAKAKAASAKNKGGKNASVSVMKALSGPRKSLSDRLASVSALAGGLKGSPPTSRRSSLLQPPIAAPLPVPPGAGGTGSMHTRYGGGSPASSRAPSPSLSPSRPPSPLLVARMPSPSPSPFLLLPPAQGNRLPAPNQRFMECNVEELRISEVAELLREYRRLVEGIRARGGFEA